MSEPDPWASYIGREVSRDGVLDTATIARFDATLGLDHPSGSLPLGFHWCAGVETYPTDTLGTDGHPPKGDFLPPIPLPRRMWAGGALEINQSLRAGQAFTRLSRIADVKEKSGRSGSLVFVTVEHEIYVDSQLHIRERQDIVYRPAEQAAETPVLPPAPAREEGDFLPDSRLLFRYSALTFNSHRIHYDLPYAQAEENYPALVVHGPLQATLLAAKAANVLGRPLRRFSFRGVAPAFANVPLAIRFEQKEGGALGLHTQQFGKPCMQAEAA
ncbi:FAS1-like dehydratase domain-containing protein [Brucella haematophila]|uniref:FAS1-like dehydratase domain-containing protein n=1 Tax=Brucella haematophila TaxID=419474 RepID=UPI00110E0987|nr:MaoC family dehydratase N-terminal domain-containing protein [Brucella haematophila]TMV04516.1 protein dehydratase [Brucella haematophila]